MESSLCEKPERHASRRLSDHLTFEGQKQKVHSLVDKVYARKNSHLAWERVRANRGASGTDRITIEEFEANLCQWRAESPHLWRLNFPHLGGHGDQPLM